MGIYLDIPYIYINKDGLVSKVYSVVFI